MGFFQPWPETATPNPNFEPGDFVTPQLRLETGRSQLVRLLFAADIPIGLGGAFNTLKSVSVIVQPNHPEFASVEPASEAAYLYKVTGKSVGTALVEAYRLNETTRLAGLNVIVTSASAADGVAAQLDAREFAAWSGVHRRGRQACRGCKKGG
jgi:hypothetical protein